MTDINQDPWTGNSTWTIVGADVDLEHVFAPQNRITFEFDDGGFKVVPEGPAKVAQCFEHTFLRRAGSVAPTLKDVAGIDTLAGFSARSATDRNKIMEILANHVDPKEDLLHLEGMISILCHATDKQLQHPPEKKPHPPLEVKTKICVYQVHDPVANALFLLIRAPSSPECPLANGDGTVLGQS